MKVKNALYVYWPAIFFLFTVATASLYDPTIAENFFPFSFNGSRWVDMIFSWPMLLCVVPTVAGLTYARKVWGTSEAFSLTDKMATVWFLMNATWYHIGCDVFSGLFQVMPNLTEAYQAMNHAHFEPMHHPARIALDSVYWFELFVQMPLSYVVFFLYLKRSTARPGVEAFLCGLHLMGTVAYYAPNLIMGESAHPLISNMDRSIGSLWIWMPIILTIRATRQIQAASAGARD